MDLYLARRTCGKKGSSFTVGWEVGFEAKGLGSPSLSSPPPDVPQMVPSRYFRLQWKAKLSDVPWEPLSHCYAARKALSLFPRF